MAPVNPTIQPRNDPSYGQNSRAVDVPDSIKPRGVETNQILPKGQEIGDRSAEFEGQAAGYGYKADAASTEGFADLFSGVAKVGDFLGKAGVELVKKDIENKVYDVANAERENYTQTLEQIKSGVGTKNILAPEVPEGGVTEAPQEVQDLGERLTVLTGAKDAGKLSATDYQGRLLAEAKTLRARYPGFRQEIDEAFSKVTGSNPANAYVRDLITDINRTQQQLGSRQNKALGYIWQNRGLPDADKMYQGVLNGTVTDSQVIQWAAPHEQLKVRAEELKAKMDVVGMDRKEKSHNAEQLYQTFSSGVINNAIATVTSKLGLNDPASVQNVAEALQSGAIDPKTWESEGQKLLSTKVLLRAELIKRADSSGVSANIEGGRPEVIKRIDADLSQIDEVSKRIYAQDTGGLYSLKRDLTAMKTQDTRDLLGNSIVGPPLRQAQIMHDIGGENWSKDFSLDMIKGKFPEHYTTYVNGWAKEIVTQSNYQANGKPATFKDMFNEFQQKNVNVPEASNKILGIVDKLTDPKTPEKVKLNIADAAFSPENQGMISKLNLDTVDSRGRQVRGQQAVFQQFTSEAKTKEMKKLGDKNPEVWQNYVNWAETTMAKELMPRELANLKTVGEDKNLKISWSPDNKRFDVRYVRGESQPGYPTPVDPDSYPPYVLARQSLNRINSNLSNYKNIAEASGGDVDTFLLKSIKNMGGDISNVGIPKEMLQRIDDARNFQGRFGASQRQR